jgi:hypothetical protein
MTVNDLQTIKGQWIQDSQEVKNVNEDLGEWFDSYFLVEPEDFGNSGQYQVYGCQTNIPYLDSRVKGPFNFPRY